ncbi:MAG: hypothetical protein QOJ63_3119, partial [Solirubrobacteraceae bacterium]|nr:hypothetical protein [Solirubrobacteraceae bacterium]
MTEAPTGAPVDGLPLAREVRTLGELRGAAMRHRLRMEPLAEVAGAAVAATVVAVEASSAPANALTLTFLVFLLAGTTLGRRPHWTAMLRFTHATMDLLYRAVAAAGVWVVLDAPAVAQAPVAALALAAVAATATATLARRVPASAST